MERRLGRTGLYVLASVCVLAAAVALFAASGASAAYWMAYLTTERVSVSSEGAQGNGLSYAPAVSADGRYVAFHSEAPDLVPGDTNGAGDVFVRDLASRTTTRVSVSSGGAQGSGNSYEPAVSADGRYVAFYSWTPDLVPGDTNGAYDVFVRDLASRTTTRVSVSSAGAQGSGSSFMPAVSADGRYVAFYSAAPDLVPGDTNGTWDVFVRDLASRTTTRVSVSSAGAQGSGSSLTPAVSADGRYVAFHSEAPDLVPGDTNGMWDVFVRDLASRTTTRVSVSSGGAQGSGGSYTPAVSADGRYVAFYSAAPDLVPGDTNGMWDVFVRDLASRTTTRVSVSSGGAQGNGHSDAPAVSADGRYVAFSSSASNFVSGDTNGAADIFVRDLPSRTTRRASVSSGGAQGGDSSYAPAVSADGRYVAFYSEAPDLVSGDTNGMWDVFVRRILNLADGAVRVEGPDRYATSVEASKRAFWSAGTVVIATGANWPDALGGSALAGAVRGPLLLTKPGSLPTVVSGEITRLGAGKAYLLGGELAVSGAVEDALVAKLGRANVTRLFGPTRYATARAVADEVIRVAGGAYGGDALVATGGNFPDATAASPLAFALVRPILLANPTSGALYVPAATQRALILGGAVAVPPSVESALVARLGSENVTRSAGDNRYETAARVAQRGVDAGMRWDGVGLATGANFPDALSGGAMLGSFGSVMLLTPGDSLALAARARLAANAASISALHVIGGPSAVSAAVMAEAKSAAGVN